MSVRLFGVAAIALSMAVVPGAAFANGDGIDHIYCMPKPDRTDLKSFDCTLDPTYYRDGTCECPDGYVPVNEEEPAAITEEAAPATPG